MFFRSWFRPPRRLVVLFLALMVVPSVLLVVLGLRLFQQDRASTRQELEDRRRQAADLVVADLDRSLGETEAALEDRPH
jgi:hypothetical protein